MPSNHDHLDEYFIGDDLDSTIWFPYYLPHWSSRAESRATYAIRDGELHLSIPPEQPLWCPDLHDEPLRVSCIQTGSFAGPLGSTIGQMPFREGLTVREEQPTFWGYTPLYGQIEVRMRAIIDERSMFAFWLSGIEDQPERSGEICVAEIFGDAIDGSTVHIGMGIKKLRDPRLEQAFTTIPMQIDVAEYHTYAMDWRLGSVAFMVDGLETHRLEQSPDYPIQLMLGVFDFPARCRNREAQGSVPELMVSYVRGLLLD